MVRMMGRLRRLIIGREGGRSRMGLGLGICIDVSDTFFEDLITLHVQSTIIGMDHS
jgi:hypothetical protein